MEFTVSTDIDAAPETVWAIWSDIERWPEWTASVSRVRPVTPGPLAIGLRARVRQPKLPPATWRVTELEPGRGFTWISTSPGAHVTGFHRIEPRAGGSRVSLGVIYDGPVGRLVGRLASSITQRYLHLEADGLKARSEASAEARS